MADTSTMDGAGTTEAFGARGVEVVPEFIPTPERVSQYLAMDHEQVLAELKSVEGRQRLHRTLIEREDDLRSLYPTFNAESLQSQLNLVGETLSEKERFLSDAGSPEKKGIFRRAWEIVKAFPKKHPIVTAILMVALMAAGAWRLGWLPKFDSFGFGLGKGGGGGMTGGAGLDAAESTLSATDAVIEAAKKLATSPQDLVTVGKSIIFRGIVYDRDNLAPLVDAIRASGIDTSHIVRIVRDPTSRALTEMFLKKMLMQDLAVRPENIDLSGLLREE